VDTDIQPLKEEGTIASILARVPVLAIP